MNILDDGEGITMLYIGSAMHLNFLLASYSPTISPYEHKRLLSHHSGQIQLGNCFLRVRVRSFKISYDMPPCIPARCFTK